jgi:hypothetical protein
LKTIPRIATILAGLALLPACSTPKPVTSDGVGLERPQASIPFANQRNAITSWQADGREGLWVQDGRRNWYYAKFIGFCEELDHAVRLGFDTGTSERLDRFSYVLVPGNPARCAIQSFTRSDEPPEGKRRTLDGESAK